MTALDLIVGVQARPDELEESHPAIEFEGDNYRIWREVSDFADRDSTDEVFIADRTDGLIVMAPAARTREPQVPAIGDADGQALAPLRAVARPLAAVPREGRRIRAWYRRGGGPAGNVAAGTITVLRDAIPGVRVSNPAAASGGRAAESLPNALIRGPQELRTLRRAITARDFQLLARRGSGSVARAHAFTQAALWQHATPGTVDLVLVPAPPEGSPDPAPTAAQLQALESDEVLRQVSAVIDAARPLGTRCEVSWARYTTVHVQATIVIQREEDRAAVESRVDQRLRQSLSPLATQFSDEGWPFGRSLYASNVYKIILSEPGVRYAHGIRLNVDEVPDSDVRALEADRHQPRTWYAGSSGILFRSLDDGDGWEPLGRFDGGEIRVIRSDDVTPGLVVVAVDDASGEGSSVHVSRDAGGTWPFVHRFGFSVRDVAWIHDQPRPELLLAGAPSRAGAGTEGGGLWRMGIQPDDDPVLVNVDPANQARAFAAVAAHTGVLGDTTVAVATDGPGGIFQSSEAGASGTFTLTGLDKEDVRILAVQVDGPRAYLWAATAAPGGDQPGNGCFRSELLGSNATVEGWVQMKNGWSAGTCRALAFDNGVVLAATWQAGVLRLDPRDAAPTWSGSTVDSGLPMRDPGRFEPVLALATRPTGGLSMAGSPDGVLRSLPGPTADAQGWTGRWEICSSKSFSEQVTLPPTGLFVCGENTLEVRSDATG